MNTDGEMLPTPEIEIKPALLKKIVELTPEDGAIIGRVARRMRATAGKGFVSYPWIRQRAAARADDIIMLTRTMCPEAKPAVKDLAVFLKFSQ
jgi:hypothetical protein